MPDTTKAELVKAGEPDITRLLEPGEQVVWQGRPSQANPTIRRQASIRLAIVLVMWGH